VLGRALQFDEVLYVTEMARRIAAILLMRPELDANYRAVVADAIDWQGFKGEIGARCRGPRVKPGQARGRQLKKRPRTTKKRRRA
jgi:hypothetical protein